MRFRFPARWQGRDQGPNPLTEAVTALRSAGRDLLDLTVSNPTIVGLPFPEDWPLLLLGNEGKEGTEGSEGSVGGEGEASHAALHRSLHGALHRYDPDPRGLVTARRAIASYYNERGEQYGTVSPDDFFLTAGTSEAYAHLFKLLCEPGDSILVPRPSYPLLETLADLAGLTLASYPLTSSVSSQRPEAIWRPDRKALSAAITPRTKIIVAVNPNNPTGSVLSPEDAAWLLTLAEEHGIALIVDEVFADYRCDGGTTTLIAPSESGPLVFTLNGLSKLVGLPQLKLAWIHVAGNPADRLVAAEALEWMCDAALSVGTAPQLACAGLLQRRDEFQGPLKDRIATNLASLGEVATGHARLKPLWPQGGWCVPVRCEGIEDDEDFAILLVEEKGVLVQPGYFFDFDDEETIVVSLLTPPEVFREGVTRIARALETLT